MKKEGKVDGQRPFKLGKYLLTNASIKAIKV